MNDTRSTNRGRRILVRIAVVLCLLLAAGVLPMAAFAAPTTVSDVEATYLNTATINLMATVAPGANLQTYYQLDGGACLLYTSDAADEEDSVDLGGRRIIKKKKFKNTFYS